MIGIGYPGLVVSTTNFSAGSWLAGLPLTNLRNLDLAKVARSTDATSANTKFTADHGSAKTARALCLVGTNLSSAATIRWKRGTSSGGSEVSDSGALNAWVITPLVYNGKRHNMIIVMSSANSARYDTIEIVDTSNSDGYVEIGFCWISDLFVPAINASYGLKDQLIDHGSIERSESGAVWATTRRKFKSTSFVLEWLTQTEADTLHELERVAGTTDPIIYIPDLTDRAMQQRYGGMGLLGELSAIDYPFVNNRSLPLKWVEYA